MSDPSPQRSLRPAASAPPDAPRPRLYPWRRARLVALGIAILGLGAIGARVVLVLLARDPA